MEDNIKSLIADCKKVVDDIEGHDDPYRVGQLHTTQAIIARLELILVAGNSN